jgi:hypothetical protein
VADYITNSTSWKWWGSSQKLKDGEDSGKLKE